MAKSTLTISSNVSIPENEIEITSVRSQGAGGQNINKVSTAIHLRFDIHASSLPDFYKNRLLTLKDSRVNKGKIIIIKAQRFRSQEKNREDALHRLKELIKSAAVTRKKRKATKPTRSSKLKRLNQKILHGRLKELRKKVIE